MKPAVIVTYLPLGAVCFCAIVTFCGALFTLNIARKIANIEQIEVIKENIIDAKKPILTTLTVKREVEYAGEQISTIFSQSIRGKSYIVEMEQSHKILYSQMLQDLKPGTKVRGWFQPMAISNKVSEGELIFLTPLDVISVVYTTEGSVKLP